MGGRESRGWVENDMCCRWSICVLLMGMLLLLFTFLKDHAAPPADDAPQTCLQMDRGEHLSKNIAGSGKHKSALVLKYALKFFGADFFDDSKVEEMAEGAMDFNVPLFKENRELVASMNGGLYDPSALVFNPSWNNDGTTTGCEKFSYPVISGIKRPNKEEDMALMTVLELAELMRPKQITSVELTEIFLKRLKRLCMLCLK